MKKDKYELLIIGYRRLARSKVLQTFPSTGPKVYEALLAEEPTGNNLAITVGYWDVVMSYLAQLRMAQPGVLATRGMYGAPLVSL